MPIAAGVAKLVLDLYQSVEQIVQQRQIIVAVRSQP